MLGMTLRSVSDADVRGKRVLVRVDFNVPMQDGVIIDDARIKAALPTINLLLKNGASRILLLTHLGRPEGKVVEAYRVAPLVARLREYVDSPIIELDENLRFDPREEANDPSLAQELAAQGDIYVDEAFSNAHRSHASMVGIPTLLPSFAGLELLREMAHLSEALTPPSGALAIIGGAKFETKRPLLEKLLKTYATILLGGALANDLLKARGLPVGSSLVSAQPVPEDLAGDERVRMPDDVRVEGGAQGVRVSQTADVRSDERIIDIGTMTENDWSQEIARASFVLWNGPMGVYEKGYVEGTDALARALVSASCKAVIGGGDTEASLKKFTFDAQRIFVSTGGGAMLACITNGGSLPALDALQA
jgi:phosphoglycerate kinase